MGISVDPAQNIFLVGYFMDTVDFDPGPTVSSHSSAGDFDAYVQKLDENGDFQWVITAGSSGYYGVNQLIVDSTGALLVTGEFNASVDFDPDTSVAILNSNGQADVLLQKISQVTVSLPHWSYPRTLTVYPNPSNGYIHLYAPQGITAALRVFNSSGKLMWESKAIALNGSAFNPGLPPGLYLLEATTDEHRYYQQLIIR